jgi:hypothetical protein
MRSGIRLARHGIDITRSAPQLLALVSASIHRSGNRHVVSVRDVLKIHFLKSLSSLLLKRSRRFEAEPVFQRYCRGSKLNRRCGNCSGSRQQN